MGNPSPVKIGILGTGRIAAVMAETLKKLRASGSQEVTLAAVASRSLGRAQEFIKENGLDDTAAFGSYEDLAKSDCDLIYVATPNQCHCENACLCLRHGKHVLVEKPFSANRREAELMLKTAAEHQVLLTEGIWTRYQPLRGLIASELAEGAIGTPLMLEANLGYPIAAKKRIVSPEYAGGALLDLGVYVLNFALMFFGHPEDLELSCVKNAAGMDMQDTISLRFSGGRMASLCVSALCAQNRRAVISGSKGYLEVYNINNPERYRIYDAQYRLLKTVERPAQLTGFEYEVLEAARCLREGQTECPSVSHEESLYVMGLLDSLRAQGGIVFPQDHKEHL
ncbi:MAG: Gfo/Idh/MocA family oxidoreductase [Succinivibrio sp.]|nr:Gfo/Idh/MocA family oxidoreductase [Succinivibrio sp.]